MLYLTCTTITSVDLAHCGVSRAKYWVSVDCGTNISNCIQVSQTAKFSGLLYVAFRERILKDTVQPVLSLHLRDNQNLLAYDAC